MTFALATFKEVGGPGNNADGGQMYSVENSADTLATMMASGYMDAIEDSLNTGDTVIFSGSDGIQMCRLTNTAGVITVEAAAIAAGPTQAIAGGGGAADLTSAITEVTSTGADVVTLAAGLYIGQKKTINCIVDGGSVVVTPAATLGLWSTCTLLAAGDAVHLQWNGAGWFAIGVGAGTVALPIFA